MALNFDNYNQQVASIQGQLAALQQKQYPTQPVTQLPYIPSPQFQQEPEQIPQPPQYVDGPDGARRFQQRLLNNSSAIVFDKNDDIFYGLSKDANGISPAKLPRYRFVLEDEIEENPVYVTKDDLEKFKAELLDAISKSTEEKK